MLPSEFQVINVGPDKDPILRNLLQFYIHDMAEWFKVDQISSGNYVHSTDPYWKNGHHVYLLFRDSIPIGFGLVGPADEWLPSANANDMDEFFIVRRHRGVGLASAFAEEVWRKNTGHWLVRVFQANKPALPFWRKTIAKFTDGVYEEEVREKDGNLWSFFEFESPSS